MNRLPTLGTALGFLAVVAALTACAVGAGTAALRPAGDAVASTGGMRELTSVQLSKEMVPGINLGNTLEAIPNETAWGQPVPTQALMDAYRAAGFKSVRLPIAWSQYADAQHRISPQWMAHVKEVVGYARKAGLYVVINVHWDGGWMDHPTYDQQAAINGRLATLWTQIATAFKDQDDHLLFAGTNEVGMPNTSGLPKPEWAAVQNSFNQTFVDTVRATGGHNARRHLVVQGYFTNIDNTVAINTVPKDSVPNRLFMEVHYYDPYNFTLNGDSQVWQWGSIATDASATETWANEPWADSQFQKMKTAFVDQGVGVIVGEYGAYVKRQFPGMAAYRRHWAQVVTRSIVQHGLVPMWWDAGELIDRGTGMQKLPDVIGAIVNAAQ
ncbi:glycoside hydrolase family 5 protein [Ideonella sp. YS5]|uniref:glycoside hydrolase family 5 protein n=1 Tax=Ideonella sp. YS5 TaxID=3453714 RepID=UPI003EEE6902